MAKSSLRHCDFAFKSSRLYEQTRLRRRQESERLCNFSAFALREQECVRKVPHLLAGVVAQLVEHHNGIVGVRGSNPLGSTSLRPAAESGVTARQVSPGISI
jgi:hypothetical protein